MGNCLQKKKIFIDMELKKFESNFVNDKKFLDKYVGKINETIVTTHVTSPFIKLNTIKRAAKMLSKYDSIAAITKDYNFAWIKKRIR